MSLTPEQMYPDIASVCASIRMFADEHKLTPVQVADLFNAGLAATRQLRPEWFPAADPALESASA